MANELTDQCQEDRLPELLRPLAAHDGFSFAELQKSYNFGNISDRRRVFCKLVVDALKARPNPVLLDIGCGRGIARDTSWQWAMKPFASKYLGLEPDRSVTPAEGLFDETQSAILEDVSFPDDSVDVAYSWMVMEHVADPQGFCSRLYRLLKPGGTYFFVTPNLKHYFTRIASGMNALNLDELVLRRVLKKDQLEEYHYPVQYKFNCENDVSRAAESAGFEQPEFAYLETSGATGAANYFPGPTRLVYHLLCWKRKRIRNPKALLVMVGKLQKPR